MSRRTWNGERAREARKEAGLSPEAVAEHVGAHRASVYGWEAGREPQMRHAVALADLYALPLDSFFVHEPEGVTTSDGSQRDAQESPANADALVAVVSGAANAEHHEGALTKE